MLFNDWPWLHWSNTRQNSLAVTTDTKTYTWSDLSDKIYHIAAYLSYQGLTKKKIVVLIGNNSIDILCCQLAVIASGSIVLVLNPSLPCILLEELFNELNIDFIIDFDCKKKWNLKYFVLNFYNYKSFTLTNKFKFINFFKIIKTPATLILTSGSTKNLPKAVVHNIFSHLTSACSVLNIINYQQHDCWLLSLPLFHISGQGIVWRWLLRGGILALKKKILLDSLNNITHISLVPSQLYKLLDFNRNLCSSLKEILLGGDFITPILIDKIINSNIVCWSSYGMTEMASTICIKKTDFKGGVGFPLKGKRIRLINNEIQVKSNSQALGYWLKGKIVRLSCTKGWFKTNDKGALINGIYHITGRLDNLFINRGECIQPEYIEKIINSYPYVIQSFIIPIDNDQFGKQPVAVLKLKDESLISDVAKWLKDKLAPYQYPVYFYNLDSKFEYGVVKISRKQIKQWLLKKIMISKKNIIF